MITRYKVLLAVLGGGVLALATLFLLEGGIDGPTIRLDSRQFALVSGQGSATQAGFQLTGAGDNAQAMVVANLPYPVSAAEYVSLTFKAPGLDQVQGSGVFWITAGNPTQAWPRALALPEVQAGEVQVVDHPQWSGQITRIGFVVQGPLMSPVTFQEVGLIPRSVQFATVLDRLAGHWTTVSEWDGGSINFFLGVERSERRISPSLLMLCWVIYFGLIYLLLRGPNPTLTLTIALLAATFVLDARWQMQLWYRHFNHGDDPVLVKDERRAQKLSEARRQLLDSLAEDQRLFIVSDDPSGYDVYRTRYHLGSVPTSFGLDRLPRSDEWRPGDLMLVLGLNERLDYQRSTRLVITRSASLPATLLSNTPEAGAIFQLRAED